MPLLVLGDEKRSVGFHVVCADVHRSYTNGCALLLKELDQRCLFAANGAPVPLTTHTHTWKTSVCVSVSFAAQMWAKKPTSATVSVLNDQIRLGGREEAVHAIVDHAAGIGFRKDSHYALAIDAQRSYRTMVVFRGVVHRRTVTANHIIDGFAVRPLLVLQEHADRFVFVAP